MIFIFVKLILFKMRNHIICDKEIIYEIDFIFFQRIHRYYDMIEMKWMREDYENDVMKYICFNFIIYKDFNFKKRSFHQNVIFNRYEIFNWYEIIQ